MPRILSACLLISIVLASRAYAIPGDYDPTFAGSGFVRIGFGQGDDHLFALALQADGKSVSVGESRNGFYYDVLVMRHLTNGTPDPAFGTNGQVKLDLSGSHDIGRAVAIQADQKIVVAGEALGRYVAIRLLSNGSLDPAFGTGGVVTLGASLDQCVVRAVLLQGTKILLVGKEKSGTAAVISIIRLNNDGSLDLTFDGDGKLTTPGLNYGEANAALLQPSDGSIVVAGFASDATNRLAIALLRFSGAGVPDGAFGAGGKVITYVGASGSAMANAMVQFTPLGGPTRLAVAGQVSTGGAGTNAVIALYEDDGLPVPTFATNGVGTYAINGGDVYYGIGADSNTPPAQPRIYASGRTRTSLVNAQQDMVLGRVNLLGTPDASFDGDGYLFLAPGPGDDALSGMLLPGDDTIEAVGSSAAYPGNLNAAIIRRQMGSGAPDATFGVNGLRTDDIGDAESHGQALALPSADRIVVAGEHKGADWDFAVAQLHANGTLDAAFAGGGRVTASIDGNDYARGLVIQADSRIVVAGYSGPSTQEEFSLVRFQADGSLDPSFDGDGRLTSRIGFDDGATSLVVQPDGKLVAAGWSGDGFGYYRMRVSRFLASGTPDPLFATGGHFIQDFGGAAVAEAVALQPNGRIVVAGYRQIGNNTVVLVVRLNANGTLDNSFDGDGWVTTSIGGISDFATEVVIQPNGRILVCGRADQPIGGDHILVRYLADGRLDTIFDGDGVRHITIGPQSDGTDYGLALHPNGQILVAGEQLNAGNEDHSAFRLNPDGSNDLSWGGSGSVLLDPMFDAHDYGRAIGVDGTGRIVTAGWSSFLMCVIRLDGTPPTSGIPPVDDPRPAITMMAPRPNPTRTGAALSFDLSSEGFVAVDIFDVTGRRIRQLFSRERVAAGHHPLDWDLRDESGVPVSSGVYQARVESTAGKAVRRIVVAR